MTRRQTCRVTQVGCEPRLPKRGMTFGPKPLLPYEVENGQIKFVLMGLDCDKVPPGTCGTSTRGCATCCVPPPPPMTPEVARILLNILLRSIAGDAKNEEEASNSSYAVPTVSR